jgi:hypothetical protein
MVNVIYLNNEAIPLCIPFSLCQLHDIHPFVHKQEKMPKSKTWYTCFLSGSLISFQFMYYSFHDRHDIVSI